MRLDVERVTEQVNAFWSDHGYAMIAAAGLLVLVLVAVTLVKIARSGQRDRWVAGMTAVVVLAWTSEGLWEVARHTLELPQGFAIMTFFVYEAMMVTSALQAERHRKHHPTPGPPGRYVWVLASLTASIVALNAPTLVEALLRFTLPLAATGLWWLGITAERESDSARVRRLREKLRRGREAHLRRARATIGLSPPGTLPRSETMHERHIQRMVAAGVRLHSAKPGSRRARRATRRLCRLAMLASDNDIVTVRGTVERAVHVVELILPTGPSPAIGTTGASSRPSHRTTDDDDPHLATAVPRNDRPQPTHGPVTGQHHPVNGANHERRTPHAQEGDGFAPFSPAGGVLTPRGQDSSGSPSGARSTGALPGTAQKGQPGTPQHRNDQPRMPTLAHSGEQSPGPQASLASSQRPPRSGRAGGSRLTAARLYRASMSAGQRLSVSALAEQAGCCRTTAWRAIRWSQSADSPAPPTGRAGPVAAQADRPG